MKDFSSRLHELYADASKHSKYQNIPVFVREALGYTEQIDESWRGDTARYQYILGQLEEIDFYSRQVLGDVGANTGFFALSLAHDFPKMKVVAYETNSNHVTFMQEIVRYFGLPNIEVNEQLIEINNLAALPLFDVLLHLNILHHAGHDFDKGVVNSVSDFEFYVLDYLTRLRQKTGILIFQMGTNWGGDKAYPIVLPTDDYGKLRLMLRLLMNAGWEITHVALATKDTDKKICYRNLPAEIIAVLTSGIQEHANQTVIDCLAGFNLDQFVGEFYRRPIIICRST